MTDIEWKVVKEDFETVLGAEFIQSIEQQFKKKGKKIQPRQLLDILYRQKKIDEDQHALLKDGCDAHAEESNALTIPKEIPADEALTIQTPEDEARTIQKQVPRTNIGQENYDGTLGLGGLEKELTPEKLALPKSLEQSSRVLEQAPISSKFTEPTVRQKPDIAQIKAQLTFDETRYKYLGDIGQGGMGAVQKYRDRKLNRIVAVKRISSGQVDERQIQRFLREIELTARLDNYQIIQALDVGYDKKGDLCFVMEFVKGKELSKVFKHTGKGKKHSLPNMLEVIIKTLTALKTTHKAGMVHRDVKPDNIMLVEEERYSYVKLMDFGLVKDLKGEEPDFEPTEKENSKNIDKTGIFPTSQLKTAQNLAMGTPVYMAPEQSQNFAAVDARADLYAVGVMLYEMLTGKRPIEGKSIPHTLTLLLSQKITPPSKASKQHVSKDLDAIVMKALAKKPEHRYQSAEEFIEDIEAFRAHQLVKARKYTWFDKAIRFIQNHKTTAATAGLVLSAGITGLLGYQSIETAKATARAAQAEEEKANLSKELAEEKAKTEEKKRKKAEAEVEGQQTAENILQTIKYIRPGEGYYEAVLEIITDARDSAKKYWKPYLELAKHEANFGHHTEAEQNFDLAARVYRELRGQDSVEIWFLAGMHYGLPKNLGGKGEEEKALEYFERAYESDSSTTFGRLAEAVSLIIKSKINPAEANIFLPKAISLIELLKSDRVAKTMDATWLSLAWVLGATAFTDYLNSSPAFREYANLEAAKNALERVAEENQENIGIQNFLAQIHTSLNQPEKAIEILTRLLKMSEHPIIYLNRGLARKNQGDLEGAMEDYLHAFELNPDNDAVHGNIGVLHLERKKPEQAMRFFDDAIRLNPLDVMHLYNRGTARIMQGRLDEAISDFERAKEINPLYDLAFAGLGNAYRRKGNLELAITHYNQALEINPQCITALCGRAMTHEAKKDLTAAIQDYAAILAIDPTQDSALVQRGRLYANNHQTELALQDLLNAIKHNPQNSSAYLTRAQVFTHLKRFGEAETDLRKSISLGNILANVVLGVTQMQAGNLEEAEKTFQEAYKKAPKYKNLIDQQMEQLRKLKEK